MPLENYEHLECEANAHTPLTQSHHLHIPRGYDSKKLLDKIQKEALGELERWQNYWPFGMTGYTPINTIK